MKKLIYPNQAEQLRFGLAYAEPPFRKPRFDCDEHKSDWQWDGGKWICRVCHPQPTEQAKGE